MRYSPVMRGWCGTATGIDRRSRDRTNAPVLLEPCRLMPLTPPDAAAAREGRAQVD